MATFRAPGTLFAVDLDRRLFCYVKAETAAEAVGVAERFLPLRPEEAVGNEPRGNAPSNALRLRARRATVSEQAQFTAETARDGEMSPYLAGVLVG